MQPFYVSLKDDSDKEKRIRYTAGKKQETNDLIFYIVIAISKLFWDQFKNENMSALEHRENGVYLKEKYKQNDIDIANQIDLIKEQTNNLEKQLKALTNFSNITLYFEIWDDHNNEILKECDNSEELLDFLISQK